MSEPFAFTVEHKFQNWLIEQLDAGRQFTEEQLVWLEMIKDHIAGSASIEIADFEEVPFNQKGGAIMASQVFGDDFGNIIQDLNSELIMQYE